MARKMTRADRTERTKRRALTSTTEQRARRARKSKAFFARHAQRAALAGNSLEATRLLTWSIRKRTIQRLAETVLKITTTTGRAFALAA